MVNLYFRRQILRDEERIECLEDGWTELEEAE
jgi:hypothetical protein